MGYQLRRPVQQPLSHHLHTPSLTTWPMFDRGISELKLQQEQILYLGSFKKQFFGCRKKLIVRVFLLLILV
ncbi:Uncharacterized protein TCM_029307 [Theobroma cacao]|uniref:Uncharacterized protein n=1 Tax=Theobroma cacao TaxID=3641 RepID=A0A061GK38_THECC|nr:Uncharacterized protein TCM_029307 [Theobroma cacao]